MRVGIVTLFPEMFAALTDYGVSGKAVRHGLVQLEFWNPRDFTTDKHRTVDDKPYGGGPGMLMKSEPVSAALREAGSAFGDGESPPAVVYLSPQGRKLDQRLIEELASRDSLVLLCGRYEGIDERVIESLVDEEYSLGDYVISGGELAAMILVDALIRLQPGALGDEASAGQDSFSAGLLDYPNYTRPEEFEGRRVPEVLLSGKHEEIARWRLKQSLGRTWLRRPELLEKMKLDARQQALLDEFRNEYEQK